MKFLSSSDLRDMPGTLKDQVFNETLTTITVALRS